MLKYEWKLCLKFLLLLFAEQDSGRRLVKCNCYKWSCSGYTGHEIKRQRYNADGFKGNMVVFALKSRDKNILKSFKRNQFLLMPYYLGQSIQEWTR